MVNINHEVQGIAIGRDALYGYVDIDASTLPAHVNEYIYEYGIRQILNDAVSDKNDKYGNRLTAKEILAKAQAKYDQLVRGELRARNAAEPADPVMAEAFKLAKKRLEEAFRAKGLWPAKGDDKFQRAVDARLKSLKKPEMDAAEYITKWLEANPAVVESAKVIVAARGEAAAELDDAF